MSAFLFSDIEGSTRLWSTFPDSMGSALELHDLLMRDAVSGKIDQSLVEPSMSENKNTDIGTESNLILHAVTTSHDDELVHPDHCHSHGE